MTGEFTTADTLAQFATADNIVFTREHPYYSRMKGLWRKATDAYNGGRDYVQKTLKKHPSETDEEFAERTQYSYNVNLIKYATARFGDYIFSKPPRRIGTDSNLLTDFDRRGKSADSLMREVFDHYTIYGLSWVFVDMPVLNGTLVDLSTKEKRKIRPYANAVAPMDVPDWDFDETGELNWIIREEEIFEKDDPTRLPVRIRRRTLYTKTYWQTYDQILDDGNAGAVSYDRIRISERHPNAIGKVPVLVYTSVLFNQYFNRPAIDDILTIHDAVLRSESELLTNILKQTYGQLVLPSSASALASRIKMKIATDNPNIDLNSDEIHNMIKREVNIELSRTKHISEDSEEKGTARYIQPAGANIENIINTDDRLIRLMIQLYGFLIGSATTQRESAESKSVDNISLAAQLSSIALQLQELENKIWEFFSAYDSTIAVPTIDYNKDYDIHELKATIAALVELFNVDGGKSYQQEVKRTAVHVLNSLHRIPDDRYEEIEKEIKSGSTTGKPITLDAQAKHHTEESGSAPDGIEARPHYQKSMDSVSKTEKV
jgi:hypothetical protein